MRVVKTGPVEWELHDWCRKAYEAAVLSYPSDTATISEVGCSYVKIKGSMLRISPEHFEPYCAPTLAPYDATLGLHRIMAEMAAQNYKITEPKKTIMTKLNTMMKKLLDTDTQTLMKAGFINGDLDLTSEGKNELWTLIFDQHKAALVEAAKAKIAEEEKE